MEFYSGTARKSPATDAPFPAAAYLTERADVASAARTANGSQECTLPEGALGAMFFLNISAVSGTSPSMTVKIREKDPVSGSLIDMPGASFAAKTGAGLDSLKIYPGIAETANRKVSNRMPKTYVIDWAITGTGPSFTFSVGMVALP